MAAVRDTLKMLRFAVLILQNTVLSLPVLNLPITLLTRACTTSYDLWYTFHDYSEQVNIYCKRACHSTWATAYMCSALTSCSGSESTAFRSSGQTNCHIWVRYSGPRIRAHSRRNGKLSAAAVLTPNYTAQMSRQYPDMLCNQHLVITRCHHSI